MLRLHRSSLHRHRSSVGALAALLALAALGLAPVARADDALVLGKVKKVRDDGVLEVKERKTIDVTAGADATFGTLSGTTLADAPDNGEIVLLGRRQKEQRDPDTNSLIPAQIVQIQAIVVAEGEGLFAPPKLAARHEKAKLSWMVGVLQKRPGGFYIKIGSEETNLQFGPKRAVLLAKEDPAARDVKKNKIVLIRGDLGPGEKKGRLAQAADSLLVVQRSAPTDQLAIASGR